MQKRRIGSLDVSIVGLGGNNFGTDFFGKKCEQRDADRVIHAALDAGVNFIDTAEEYSVDSHLGTGRSEEVIGKALGARRNDVVIASKFSAKGVTNPHERGANRVISALESSLRRLGTDRIDLYQQHFPDPNIPIEEMLEALDRLVRDGKVREVGCCNFSGEMIDTAHAQGEAHGLVRFASAQNQYNLLDDPSEAGVIEACERHDLVLLPFFPLASGLLTGKYRPGEPAPEGSRFGIETVVTGILRDRQVSDQRLEKVQQFAQFAKEREHTVLDLAISWLTSQPVIASVIAGATRPEQIEANAAAAAWQLTEEDLGVLAAMRE